jgi:xanthine dehydrogenase YagR molybdenum-binding subunit
MTMLAADCLGVPVERVRFGLGDSAMPKAPQEGGSGLTGALGNAVHATCVSLVRAFLRLVSDDELSPLKGCRLEGITVRDGGIQITDEPMRFETYADILKRHNLDELTIEGESATPGETSSAAMIVREGRFIPYTAPSPGTRAPASGLAAHFVEVHVDPDLATVRVARVVSAVDGGRILNPKTARSQIIGGIAMGIGMALLEETASDRTGRLVTTSLADYVVATNADVGDVDVLFVGQPDSMTPLGTKGVGELAMTGMPAAIANAVYHATGLRVRSLPISLEKVLEHECSIRPNPAAVARRPEVRARGCDVNDTFPTQTTTAMRSRSLPA